MEGVQHRGLALLVEYFEQLPGGAPLAVDGGVFDVDVDLFRHRLIAPSVDGGLG